MTKEIEVHLGTVSFPKMLEMNLKKGDAIEVTGWKTEFEGVKTIIARKVRHGSEVFVFRAKDGAPGLDALGPSKCAHGERHAENGEREDHRK